MIELDTLYFYALIFSNVVILGLASLSICRLERRCQEIESFWGSPTGAALSNTATDNSATDQQLQVSERLAQRVGELQRTVKVMQIKHMKPEVSSPERRLPIENAIRMARQGASVDELTKSCGLNTGEAQLMKKLHGEAEMRATRH